MQKIIDKTYDSTTRDPYVILQNGIFYRCFATRDNTISVSCAGTVEGLSTAGEKVVYKAEENREFSKELWAPELHVIDGKCYIYVACDDGDNYNHRMYVLTNNSNDPMQPYVMCGKLTDESDKWAIDGTIMNYRGDRYYLWSGWEGDTNVCQNIYIAKMKSPCELDSGRVMISAPEYEWEKHGSTGEEGSPYINEGPFAFTAEGRTFVTYSASGSWCEHYCIAVLELVGEDPLDPKSWKKYDAPVLVSNNLVKGAGHCSVVCEGENIHVFFHAWDKNEEQVSWDTVSTWHGIMKISGDKIIIG